MWFDVLRLFLLLTCQDNLRRYLLRTVAKHSVHILLSVGALPHRCTLRLSKKLCMQILNL